MTASYVVSIDWLQISCRGSVAQSSINFTASLTDLHNKIFSQVWEIKRGSEVVAMAQASPVSEVVVKDLVVLKFENHLLYTNGLFDVVRSVIADFGLTPINITRLDLCADFQQFKYGLSPQSLIQSIFIGEAWRKGARIEVFHGADMKKIDRLYNTKHSGMVAYFNQYCNKAGGNITGYRAGSRSSAVCCYLYNKTIELRQQTDKPYIRGLWHKFGFDVNRDVWRLEFSLKGKAFKELTLEFLLSADIVAFYNRLLLDYFIIQREDDGIIYNLDLLDNVAPIPALENKERKASGDKSAKLFLSRCVKELRRQHDSEDTAAPAIFDTLLIASSEYARQNDLHQYFYRKMCFANLHEYIAEDIADMAHNLGNWQ